tara:strand:+ start:682 stop:2643 length:1962 start_codon:yes stop_codon:yes gene_type:complete
MEARRRTLGINAEMTRPSTREYIPHIDGLRTLAVLSVFLFHLDVPGIEGGYLGVDVFFVISGYLITQIIKEASEQRRLSFTNFYARRIRRLFPALFVVMVMSTIVGVFVLSPERLIELAHSGIAAVLSVSNFYFLSQSGYFDAASDTQVFLHTWSLAVEEQFYLVWPVLISIVVALLTKQLQLMMIIFLCLAGTGMSFVATIYDPSMAFYATPFRLAEFSLGAVLCWLSPTTKVSVWIVEGIVLIALSILLLSFVLIGADSVFPGYIFFFPCFATATLIFMGKDSWIARGLLGNALMSYVGRISYSLYLYHWPVIIYYKYLVTPTLTPADQLIVFVIAFVLSIVSHQLVETPFRQPGRIWHTGKQVAFVYCAGGGLLLSVFIWISLEGGLPSRTPKQISEVVNQAVVEKARRFEIYRELCGKRTWENCALPSKTLPNAMILGDSHGADGLNILHAAYPDVHFILASEGGCPAMTQADFKLIFKPTYPNWDKCNAATSARAASSHYEGIDYLIFSQRYSWYKPEHFERFTAALPTEFTGKVLIFGNAPIFAEDLPELVLKHGQKAGLSEFTADYIGGETWRDEKELKRVAHKHNAKFISKTDFYCDKERKSCRMFYSPGDKLLTYDKHHLSLEAAAEYGAWLKLRNENFAEIFN